MLNYRYYTLAFLKNCIHELSSDQPSGCHELLIARNTRSGCRIIAAMRPSTLEIVVISNTELFVLAGRFHLHLNGCQYTVQQASFGFKVRSDFQKFWILSIFFVIGLYLLITKKLAVYPSKPFKITQLSKLLFIL